MAESTGIKKKRVKENVKNMNASLVSLAKNLKSLQTEMLKMMTGDKDGPFWNGKKAIAFYKKASNNQNNNIRDYKDAYNLINNLAIKVENASNRDN